MVELTRNLMTKVFLFACIFLSGCVISTASEVRLGVTPAIVTDSIFDRVYYWDSRQELFYYWDNGYRVYMPRQWIPPKNRRK
jgi:hypothetical protein